LPPFQIIGCVLPAFATWRLCVSSGVSSQCVFFVWGAVPSTILGNRGNEAPKTLQLAP
jgi:hypothetical protein